MPYAQETLVLGTRFIYKGKLFTFLPTLYTLRVKISFLYLYPSLTLSNN